MSSWATPLVALGGACRGAGSIFLPWVGATLQMGSSAFSGPSLFACLKEKTLPSFSLWYNLHDITLLIVTVFECAVEWY